jgi:hypothetical protein
LPDFPDQGNQANQRPIIYAGFAVVANLQLEIKKPPRLIFQDEGARGATWFYR